MVFSVDTKVDHEEIVANMTAINEKRTEHLYPIPTAQQQYQDLRNRCSLDVAMHNGQVPDDPWALQEEQSQENDLPASPA